MGTTDDYGIYHPQHKEDGWSDEMNANLDKLGRVHGRRMTAAAWTAANPVLAAFEVGWETDTRLNKIGNGTQAWNDLGYGNAMAVGAFEWEKWSTPQTLPNGTAGYPQVTVTNWETQANYGRTSRIAQGFNPVTGLFYAEFPGWYFVNWLVIWAENPTGFRTAGVSAVHSFLQGPASPSGVTYQGGAGFTFSGGVVSSPMSLDVEQGSGGNLNLAYAALHVAFLGGVMNGGWPDD